MKKIVLLIALTVLTIGVITTKSALAEDTRPANPMASLVTKIAAKFNLNQEEVQAVFDEERQERRQERQRWEEDRLSQDVADGKITEAQKELILAKREELEATRQTHLGATLSEEERSALREKHRQEIEAWGEENGIDPRYLGRMGGRRGPKGFGPGFGNPPAEN